ncbi:MAG: hypothetical protein ABIE74_08810 [Pseudomonadota bacterium]
MKRKISFIVLLALAVFALIFLGAKLIAMEPAPKEGETIMVQPEVARDQMELYETPALEVQADERHFLKLEDEMRPEYGPPLDGGGIVVCTDGYVLDGKDCRMCRSKSECQKEYSDSPGECMPSGFCRCDVNNAKSVCRIGSICDQTNRWCRNCVSHDECKAQWGSEYNCGLAGKCVSSYQTLDPCANYKDNLSKLSEEDKKKYKKELDELKKKCDIESKTVYKEPGKSPPSPPAPTSGGKKDTGKHIPGDIGCAGGGTCGGKGLDVPDQCPDKPIWDLLKGLAKSLGYFDKYGIRPDGHFAMERNKDFKGKGLELLDIANWMSESQMLIAYEKKIKRDVSIMPGDNIIKTETKQYLQLWDKDKGSWIGVPNEIDDFVFPGMRAAEPKLKGLAFGNGYYYALIENWEVKYSPTDYWVLAKPKLVRIGLHSDRSSNKKLETNNDFGTRPTIQGKTSVYKGVAAVEIFDLFKDFAKTDKLLTFNSKDPNFQLSDLYVSEKFVAFFMKVPNSGVYYVIVPPDGKMYDANNKALYVIRKLTQFTDIPELAQIAPRYAKAILIDKRENPTKAVGISNSGYEMNVLDLKPLKINRVLSLQYNGNVWEDRNKQPQNQYGEMYMLYTRPNYATAGTEVIAMSEIIKGTISRTEEFGSSQKPLTWEVKTSSGTKKYNSAYTVVAGGLMPLYCYGEKVATWIEADKKSGFNFMLAYAVADGEGKLTIERKAVYEYAVDSMLTKTSKRIDVFPPFFIAPTTKGEYSSGLIFKLNKTLQNGDIDEEIRYNSFILKLPPGL